MGCGQSKATDVAVPTAAAVPVTSEGKDVLIDHETLASKTTTEELQNDQEAPAIDDTNQEEEEDKDQVLPETQPVPVTEPITDASVTPDSVSVDVPDSVRANFSSFNISFIDPSVSAPTSATTEPNVASMRVMSDKMSQRGDDNVGESDDRVDRAEEPALEVKSVESGEMQQVDTIEGDEVEAGKERGEEMLDVEEESVDNGGDGEAVVEVGAVGANVTQVGALEALVKEEKVVVEEKDGQSSGESEVVELVYHVDTGVELMIEKKSAEILVEQGDDLLEGDGCWVV
uniref:Uncharacterized protein n=1 Tax=Peronospora matthiolae TaxID=2874970 RepID=A0AAV1VPE4_9STRA